MKTNKKVVRLTESKLKEMIVEAVQETLNEYGNTPYGQYMLGRVASRAKKYDPEYAKEVALYADEQRSKNIGKGAYGVDDNNRDAETFRSGVNHQKDYMDAVDTVYSSVDGSPQQKQAAEDEMWARDKIKKTAQKHYNEMPSVSKELKKTRRNAIRDRYKF